MGDLTNNNLLEESSNIFGITIFESKSSGGKAWNANEASKFSKQIAGKVESARYDLNSIIGQDPLLVKEKRTKDFALMLADAKKKSSELEAQWKVFQEAQNKGFDNQANRDIAKKAYDKILAIETNAHKAWKLRHDWVTESVVDKAGQGYKTIQLAPIRGLYLLFIKFNVFNLATAYKLAALRTPEKFKTIRLRFKQMGGNRTIFDKAVEKGYKKTPILAKKMNINWSKTFTSNANGDIDNAGGRSLKIPEQALAAMPALGAGAGALIAATYVPVPPAVAVSAASGAAMGGTVGGLVSGLMGVINGMNVPLGADEGDMGIETSGNISPELAKQMAAEKAASDKEAEQSEFPIWGYFAIGGAVLLIIGVSTYFYLRKK